MITTTLYILLTLILFSFVCIRMNKQWGFTLLFASGLIIVVLCYYGKGLWGSFLLLMIMAAYYDTFRDGKLFIVTFKGKKQKREEVMEQIEIIINRWFANVKQQLADISVINKTTSFSFCCVSLPVMQIYCSASGVLLDNDYKLPATAIFRSISDFFIKVLWCLNTDNEDETRTRLYRWDKTSAREKLRLLDNLLKSSSVLNPVEVEKLKELEIAVNQVFEKNPNKGMPHVTGKDGIFEQTSNVFGADVSALLFRQYCSAIHIDTSILSGLMNNTQGALAIQGDIDDDMNELKKTCLNFAYMYFVVLNKKKGGWAVSSS